MHAIPDNFRIDVDAAARELSKRCLDKLSTFVQVFWSVIVPNDLVWEPHMDVMCDEIQACDELVFQRLPKMHDLGINVPPGSTKTKIVSILSTAWEFARMPEIKVFVGSYSDDAITGIADEIRTVMRSSLYKLLFPDTQVRVDRDSLHTFRTSKQGEFYAFTVGGTLTSKHADILKVDDPINPKGALSEAKRKETKTFMERTIPSRKVDKQVTPIYMTMQRLHTGDPTGIWLEKKKKGKALRHICLPAELLPNTTPEYRHIYVNGLLSPLRMGAEVLAEAKTDLGPEGYAGQYDQNPVPDGGLIWKTEHFIVIPDYDFPLAKWGHGHSTDWDLAYTADDENAASAYITSFKYKSRIYLDDIGWQWLEFPELVEWMKQQVSPHYIEAKASGKSAKQSLGQYGVVAIEYQVKGGKDGNDKRARAKLATPVGAAGMICIRQSLVDRFLNDSKQGILNFPNGLFADLADALAQCVQRQSGGGVRVLKEEADETDENDQLPVDQQADALLESLEY